MPFKENVKDNLKKLDLGAVEYIKKLDAESFVIYVDEKQMTVCGAKAIATVIAASKELGATNARLERYYSSGEVSGNWDNVVGYASIIIE